MIGEKKFKVMVRKMAMLLLTTIMAFIFSVRPNITLAQNAQVREEIEGDQTEIVTEVPEGYIFWVFPTKYTIDSFMDTGIRDLTLHLDNVHLFPGDEVVVTAVGSGPGDSFALTHTLSGDILPYEVSLDQTTWTAISPGTEVAVFTATGQKIIHLRVPEAAWESVPAGEYSGIIYFTVEVRTIDKVTTTRMVPAGETQDGSDWIEVKQHGIYSLLVRANVISVDPDPIFGSNNNYAGSNAQTLVESFYSAVIPSASPLKTYAVTSDVMSKLGVFGSLDDTSGFSIPSGNTPSAGDANVAFLLSYQEAASYVSKQWWTGIEYPYSSEEAFINWQRLDDEGDTFWWLRSPGDQGTSVSRVENNGVITSHSNSGQGGNKLRPAIWVKSAIFSAISA